MSRTEGGPGLEIQLRSSHVPLDDRVREHVERRLHFSLERFAARIQRVRVQLLDTNGPRGGKDKCCRLEVQLQGAANVFVEDTDADVFACIDRAADRAGRAVARAVERTRSHRERSGGRAAGGPMPMPAGGSEETGEEPETGDAELSPRDLQLLVSSAFPRRASDGALAILVDVPDDRVPDNPRWRERRRIARQWSQALAKVSEELGLDTVTLVYYPNVHSNNADLPASGYLYDGDPAQLNAAALETQGREVAFAEIFSSHQILLAPTEFSTTAPLKLQAKQYGYRAATMPGFSASMIPALRLDYGEINRQVQALKQRLDRATGADIEFRVGVSLHRLHLDLRHRTAHASGGLFPDPATAGNLPSGEAYIVPYEGEKGEPSLSAGMLPVQFGDEVVVYRIEANKAVAVESHGPASAAEAEKIRIEPAYANLAEAGFGVLAPMGVKPIGEMLLDEKLGLHIAFGRSDHFGGAVGVADFTSPEKVVHIDRVYIPETQPQVEVRFVDLSYEDGTRERLMEGGRYTALA